MLPEAVYSFDLPGLGIVFVDPLAVRRGLLVATSGRGWEWAQQARDFDRAITALPETPPQGEEEQYAARKAEYSMRLAEIEGRLVAAAYQAFDLTPVDKTTGHGVTEQIMLAVLQDYLAWMEEKKSAPEDSPT